MLVPEDAGSKPMRVEADGRWVSFAAVDADGAPQVRGSEASVDALGAKTQLEYQATATGVKETIVLADPLATSEKPNYVFDLNASPELTPKLTTVGGIDFVDGSGQVAFAVPAPYMIDSAEPEPAYSDAVTFDLTATRSGWQLAVTPDPAWLTDPARVYPVMIDPTINVKPPALDCWISAQGVNSSHCGGDVLRVGVDTNDPRRALLEFDLDHIPANANVSNGEMELWINSGETTNVAMAEYTARRITRSWTSDATWLDHNGTNAWADPGGDYDGSDDPGIDINGSTSGDRSFDITGMTKDWIDGSKPNHGVIVKQKFENTDSMIGFASSTSPTSSHWPKIELTYNEPTPPVFDKIGDRRFFTFEEQRLNDRMTAKVNVATGNLLLSESDLNIAGTGVNAAVQRHYNSLSTAVDPSGLSPGWVLGDAPTVRLEFPSTGRVIFTGPSGYRVRFDKNAAGDYVRAEPGLDGNLSFDNTSNEYRLEWHTEANWFFNTAGQLLRQQDKQGNKITYTYNAAGQLNFLTDTQNRKIDFTYTSGLLDKVTDVAGGRTYDYTYATFAGNPTQRLASYAVTSYGLDADTTNLGATTQFSYDADGRLTQVTDPQDNITVFDYVGTSRRVSSIKRAGLTVDSSDPTTVFTYPASDNRCPTPGKVIDVNGPRTDVTDVTTYCHDEHDRVVKTIDAKDHPRSSEYTSNSNVVSFNESGVAGGPAFGYGFNGDDNLTSVDLPTGGQSTASYGDNVNEHMPTGVRDFATAGSSPATWAYDYDNRGNLIEARSDAENTTFRYCYDGKGMVQRIDAPPVATTLDTDPDVGCGTANQDNDTLFSYDADGNLATVDPPGPRGTQTFTYDAVSRIKTMTDGRGVVTTYHYDALDRITQLAYTGPAGITGVPTIDYSYDTNGNLTSRQDATGNTNFTYDELNRMLTESPEPPSSTTTYTYDKASNLESIDTADEPAPVTYAYDKLNRVTAVVDQKNRTTSFDYNNQDLRTSTAYPNGVTMKQAYDDSRRLACTYAYTGAPPATGGNNCPNPSTSLLTFFSYDYTDPDTGRDTTLRHEEIDRNNRTTTYDYDTLQRLMSATTKNNAGTTLRAYSYTVGKRGNIAEEVVTGTTVPNTTTSFEYSDANELCWTASGTPSGDCTNSPAGATTYNYDDAGNLTGSSDGLAAGYNLQGQTIQITPPGGQMFQMAYADATSDRRVQAGNTRMAYNLLGLAAQGPDSGVPHTDWFIRDPDGALVSRTDRQDNTKDLFYLFDGLGSVAATTDHNGNIVRRYTYEPYGEELNPAAGDTNPWRYASGYYDKSTGMLKFGTRYYMPSVMRWTQPDPVAGKPADPMTLNSYAYVGCDPINSTDPTGRSVAEIVVEVAGLITSCYGSYEAAVAAAVLIVPLLGGGPTAVIALGISACAVGIITAHYFGFDFGDQLGGLGL